MSGLVLVQNRGTPEEIRIPGGDVDCDGSIRLSVQPDNGRGLIGAAAGGGGGTSIHAPSHYGADPLDLDQILGSLTATKLIGTIADARIPSGIARYTGTGAFTGAIGSSTNGVHIGLSGTNGAIRLDATGFDGWTISNSDDLTFESDAGGFAQFTAVDGDMAISGTERPAQGIATDNFAFSDNTPWLNSTTKIIGGGVTIPASGVGSGNLAYARMPTGVGTWDTGSGNLATIAQGQRWNSPVAMGDNPDAGTAFRLNLSTALSGTTQTGLFADPIFQSGATVAGRSIHARVRTAAASFTCPAAAALYVQNASIGAGSIITTLVGMDIETLSGGGTNIAIRTGANLCSFGGQVTVVGAFAHQGSTFGAFNVTPATRPAALTQTYATATRTHAARTAAALTDNIAGTVNATLAAIPDPADTPATADALRDDLVTNVLPKLRNALSSLADAIGKRKADCENSAQFVNVLADDLQTLGFEQ